MAPRKQVRTDKKTSKVLEAQPAKESKISKLKKGVSTADLFAAFPRTQKTSLEKPQPVAAKTHVQIAINPVKKNQKHFSIAYMFKAASARVHKPSPDKPQVVAVKTHVQKAVKPGRRSYGKGHTAKRPSSPSPPPQKLKKQKTQEPKHPLAKELKGEDPRDQGAQLHLIRLHRIHRQSPWHRSLKHRIPHREHPQLPRLPLRNRSP